MPIATLAAGAIGIGKTLGVDFGGITGFASGILGGRGGGPSKKEDMAEASRILEKTGDQLSAVISLTDKGTLSNSKRAAKKVKSAIQGRNPTLLDLQNIIDTTLGYNRNQSPEPDSNWPWGKINPLLRQMLKAGKTKGITGTQNTGTQNKEVLKSGVGAGIGLNPLKLVLLFGGAGIVIYLINQ